MKTVYRNFVVTGVLHLAFIVFTLLVWKVNVLPIGQNQTSVGFGAINQMLFEKLGVNRVWYTITEWTGMGAIFIALGFGLLGLSQFIKRKSLWKVDRDILLLGIFYAMVIMAYGFFEMVVINYRPILLDGSLEASYPSSHTMFVLCIMSTAMMEFEKRMKTGNRKKYVQMISAGIIGVTVVGRLLSGVHWFTDILGGILLAAALTTLYWAVIQYMEYRFTSEEP